MVENVTQFAVILGSFLVFCFLFHYPQLGYTCAVEPKSIKDIVMRDLTVIGHYDKFLTNSLRTRCINIWKRSICYSHESPEVIAAMFLEWYRKHTYDPDRLIENVIETVNGEFLAMTDEQLKAICDVGYSIELPGQSKVLKHNDYVDIDALDEVYLNITRR